MKYAIFFTPRSGSSWLTDIASQVDFLGTPGEFFNPSFHKRSFDTTGTADLDAFCSNIIQKKTKNDVFGFQITYHQIRRTFGEKEFAKRFSERRCFWLIREDIIAQAVSLAKLRLARIGHATTTSHDEIIAADQGLEYSAEEIFKSVLHLRYAERMTEQMILRHGYKPFRMSYEENMAADPEKVLQVMGRVLNRQQPEEINVKQRHKKMATQLNSEFAERFRKENPVLLQLLAHERKQMLGSIRRFDLIDK